VRIIPRIGLDQELIDVVDPLQLIDVAFRLITPNDFFQPQYEPDAFQRRPTERGYCCAKFLRSTRTHAGSLGSTTDG
jgi:hypothetical protein